MKTLLAIGIALLIVACGKTETENKTTAKESKPATTATTTTESSKNTAAAKTKKTTNKKTTKKIAHKPARAKKSTGKSAGKSVSTAKADTIREKTASGKIVKADPKSDNPLLAMRDRDAFKYLLVGSKGQCDRKLRYSHEACEKFIKQVMNKDERWFHIISHYKIRDKHFQDQRVYQRMRYELTRNQSAKLKSMRDDYGLGATGATAAKTTSGKKNPDQDTPYLY